MKPVIIAPTKEPITTPTKTPQKDPSKIVVPKPLIKPKPQA